MPSVSELRDRDHALAVEKGADVNAKRRSTRLLCGHTALFGCVVSQPSVGLSLDMPSPGCCSTTGGPNALLSLRNGFASSPTIDALVPRRHGSRLGERFRSRLGESAGDRRRGSGGPAIRRCLSCAADSSNAGRTSLEAEPALLALLPFVKASSQMFALRSSTTLRSVAAACSARPLASRPGSVAVRGDVSGWSRVVPVSSTRRSSHRHLLRRDVNGSDGLQDRERSGRNAFCSPRSSRRGRIH